MSVDISALAPEHLDALAAINATAQPGPTAGAWIRQDFLWRRDLTSHQKLLAIVLASHADPATGQVEISVGLLAAEVGLPSGNGGGSLGRTVLALRRLGLLDVLRRGQAGPGRPGIYVVNLAAIGQRTGARQ